MSDGKIDEIADIRNDIKLSYYTQSELVFGLVGAVGTNLNSISDIISDRLKAFYSYSVETISISRETISKFKYLSKNGGKETELKEYDRISKFMDIGNELRRLTDDGILAMSVADKIQELRKKQGDTLKAIPRKAYIIRSLKNIREVEVLRTIYGNGFYLIGVHQDKDKRKANLMEKNISSKQADELIERDENENNEYGQQSRDTFQLADFFVDYSTQEKAIANVHRLIDLVFGDPFITPTFGEYAMYMAYCASLRSADLSRQIGTVICANNEILATGANDCPKFGGGLYWSYYDKEKNSYLDVDNGRDYMRGHDANKVEFRNIARDILNVLELDPSDENISKLQKSRLGDLTEYGRVVHAEMEALAMCARNNVSCRNAELYVTTFPCHGCAKSIIASGITKVIYIEAYPKSKAFEFYDDSISKDERDREKKVIFLPFFGVGPRRYLELFAMNYNPLPDKKRKNKTGMMLHWEKETANVRSQMLPTTYMDRELEFSLYYNKYTQRLLSLIKQK